MVIIIKKYLFLLFLFIIYLILYFNNKTEQVMSYNESTYGVSTYVVSFNNGINSNNLVSLLKSYDDDYIIHGINETDLQCNDILNCIEDIYLQNNNDFYINNITTGFNVYNINITSYSDTFEKFLN